MIEVLKKYFKGDGVIWAVIVSLSIISLLAVYSSTGTLAYRFQQGNTAYFLFKHSSFLFVGLIMVYITHLIPYKFYAALSRLFLIMAIPLLLITLVFGTRINEASRWLSIPGLGFSFQTSDFAKLALIMYLARTLSLKQDNIKDFKEAFLPSLLPVALVCVLILPANFSTAAILFLTSMVMLFVGRINLKHLLALGGIGVLLLAGFITVATLAKSEGRIGTWKNRIEAFAGGDGSDNYQVEQAKIAIATGGLLGKGPGNSTQRNFLPHPYSDFIYAIIIEEYGIIGATLVVLLYLILLFRAGVIVKKCDRTFPAFLAIGLTMGLVFQAMVNMAVAVNLFPVTGQPLPLVSMGGSSLLFTSTALGVVLSVSRTLKQKEEKTEQTPDKTDDHE
jgi:cell division protein FtsW